MLRFLLTCICKGLVLPNNLGASLELGFDLAFNLRKCAFNDLGEIEAKFELGNEFAFVGRQKRLRIGNEWFRVDLLFFHRRLRCLVHLAR